MLTNNACVDKLRNWYIDVLELHVGIYEYVHFISVHVYLWQCHVGYLTTCHVMCANQLSFYGTPKPYIYVWLYFSSKIFANGFFLPHMRWYVCCCEPGVRVCMCVCIDVFLCVDVYRQSSVLYVLYVWMYMKYVLSFSLLFS